jgi:hypothetical protein
MVKENEAGVSFCTDTNDQKFVGNIRRKTRNHENSSRILAYIEG